MQNNLRIFNSIDVITIAKFGLYACARSAPVRAGPSPPPAYLGGEGGGRGEGVACSNETTHDVAEKHRISCA